MVGPVFGPAAKKYHADLPEQCRHRVPVFAGPGKAAIFRQIPHPMRALKTLLIILLAVLALGLILGLVGPKHTHVERSVTIAAPAGATWPHMSSLRANNTWSPFLEMDPSAKVTYEGEDGAVGSKSMWEGNSQVGKGQQEITAIEAQKHMGLKLNFIEPFESEAASGLDLAAMGDSSKVTWTFDGENNFISRIFCVFMDMDKMLGGEFDKGLTKLKGLAEADAARMAAEASATPTFDIQSGDRAAGTYVGIKSAADLSQADIGKFYMDNVPKLYEALGKANVKPAGPLCGLYFDWNEAKKTTSMMVCVAVPEGTKVAGLATEKVPAGKAYWTVLNGPYDGMMAAHTALGARIAADNMAHAGAVLEEYVVGQPEKDSTKYVTNIIYTVKPKS